jgi:hypothetical protein
MMCNQGKPLCLRGSNTQAVPTFLIWILDEIPPDAPEVRFEEMWC